MSSEKSGCLFILFQLLGLLPKREQAELPYRVRDDFLSPTERSFYLSVTAAVAGRGVVCPKVRLGDILFAADQKNSWTHTNRINQKHVDFLICSPGTMRPLVAIELDDSSHQRESVRERDRFKDAAFAAAGLPLMRFAAKLNYEVTELARALSPHLEAVATRTAVRPPIPPNKTSPTCPKCGVPMVQRTASRGQQAGKRFFGCPNFPRCREIAEAVL